MTLKFKKLFNWTISTFGVAVFYVLGFLLLRETHPFSRFPMYSSFPNWSYCFYLTNEDNKIISFSNFELDGGSVGHLYGSVSQELNIPYGEFMESNIELQKIGNRMMEIMMESKSVKNQKLKLYRKAFYYEKDSILAKSDLMTTYEVQ